MSALLLVNQEDKTITVEATIYTYGNFVSAGLVTDIRSEINGMWSQPLVVYMLDGVLYKILFNVEVDLVSVNEAKELLANNVSYLNNFVRIEEKNSIGRSMMGFGLGQNSGFWLVSDNLGSSTTAAHEFGHALGLPHPDRIDYRKMGYPPIMAPRGALVGVDYQWDKTALAGAYGGTMNPIHRKVRDFEIWDVIRGSVKISNSQRVVGQLSNLYFDEYGNHL